MNAGALPLVAIPHVGSVRQHRAKLAELLPNTSFAPVILPLSHKDIRLLDRAL